ncbi:MAG TPA: pyrimidine utilization protein D [Burkholderiaceae bacterium]|jgi:aminoacrylate hydrolase|nr:pyrimidine utilization protein D [Burkholderiaceae bacterium]
MPKAKIDDIEIHYDIHGDGPPVLLVAGLGGAGSYWAPQVEPLSKHFKVIVYDHRGTGQSTHQKTRYTVEGMARDVLGLLDSLKIDDVHLIGHSTGGAIGQVLGIEAPQRLRSIVMYASWTKSDPFMHRVMEVRKAAVLNGGAMAYLRATPVFLHPSWWVNANWQKLEEMEAKAVAAFPDPEIAASRIDMVLAFDRTADLHKIRTPTLVVCAEDDFLTPAYFSHQLTAAIPGARLVLMEKGGHAASQTMTEEFNRIVTGYVLEQERRHAL